KFFNRAPAMRCVLILFAVLLLGSGANAWARTWTSIDGRKLEADFDHIEGKVIMLKVAGGKVVSIPLERFSAADLAFARQQPEKAKDNTSEAEQKPASEPP